MFISFFLSKKRINHKSYDVEDNKAFEMDSSNSTDRSKVKLGRTCSTELEVDPNENRQNDHSNIIEIHQHQGKKKRSLLRGTKSKKTQLPCIEEVEES